MKYCVNHFPCNRYHLHSKFQLFVRAYSFCVESKKGKWGKGSLLSGISVILHGTEGMTELDKMGEDVACRQASTESKRSKYLERSRCFAASNAPGKQRCLRLKPVFFIEKTKWFRWVTWGMLLYTKTGIWIHLMFFFFHLNQLLGFNSSLCPMYRANLTFSLVCLSFKQPVFQ